MARMALPPFTVTIKHDLDRMLARLDALQKRELPYATAVALSRTAQDVKAAEVLEIGQVFDRPTPWTSGGVFMKGATTIDPHAFVWLKDEAGKGTPADRFLAAEVYGGARLPKRFELALIYAGAMPKGMFAVPGAAAKLDSYGNMSAGQIVQILSQLRAQRTGGYESRIGGASKDAKKLARAVKKQGYRIFVINKTHGKLVPGVWARYQFSRGSAVKPLLIFVNKAPQYRKRFPFFEVAERVAAAEFPGRLAQALREAVGSRN
jgi:hypothetical protein